MTFIPAKPTLYRGIRFRSRLEARWAVFFDAIGHLWVYEPTFPELSGVGYQPDFLIENRSGATALVEVKPWLSEWSQMARMLNAIRADERYSRTAVTLKTPLFMIVGTPGVWEQGVLTASGATAHGWKSDGSPGAVTFEWAECPSCGRVDLWPDGLPLCCERPLPTGPLRRAYERVRDERYEDG